MQIRRFVPFIAVVLLLAACGKSQQGERKDAPATVTTMRVAAQPWQDSLEALGTAQANESIAITAKVSDVVTRLAFDSGERVRAGQLLVDMNSSAQRADVAAAAATLRDAEQQLRRGSELARQQLIAQGQLDTLRANRDAAAAALASRRAAVADRTLIAPFAGVLGLRRVSVGALGRPRRDHHHARRRFADQARLHRPGIRAVFARARAGDRRAQRRVAGRRIRGRRGRHR